MFVDARSRVRVAEAWYLFEAGQLLEGAPPLLLVVELRLGGGLQLPLQLHLNQQTAETTGNSC